MPCPYQQTDGWIEAQDAEPLEKGKRKRAKKAAARLKAGAKADWLRFLLAQIINVVGFRAHCKHERWKLQGNSATGRLGEKCTPFLFTPLELRGEQKSSKMASAEITVFSSLSLIQVSPVPSGRRSALHGGDFVSRPTDNILLSSVGSWRFDPGVSAYVASTSWCKSRQSHPWRSMRFMT